LTLSLKKMNRYKPFYIMLAPVMVLFFVFHYIPMYGIRIAFYEFNIFGIQNFIGFDNFRRLFSNSFFWAAFRNTIKLSLLNLLIGMVAAVALALLLNEIRNATFKKVVQTVVYLPHFLSWVVVASIFTMLLSPQGGIINEVMKSFGIKPIYFLTSEKWWTPIFVFVTRWKETGWGTIIYLAALTGIDPNLYEAASIDGAGRLKQTWHITLPSLLPTILIVLIMNLARVLNIFESAFVLQNPLVYDVADVIGTYVYRVGMLQADYDYSTAVGLFKSLISMVLVIGSNRISRKIRGESIL